MFINSGAGFNPARAGWVSYAASKHALRALADGLREEVNPKGVRVLTAFLDRPAYRCVLVGRSVRAKLDQGTDVDAIAGRNNP